MQTLLNGTKRLLLNKFDHFGIVVRDIQRTVDDLSRLLGFKCQEQMELKEVGIRMAFFPLCGVQMELIQFERPIGDVDPIVTRPRAGVQHVAFRVANLEEAITELTRRGMTLVRGFPRKGARGRVAFFHPIDPLDLLIEVCQHTDSHSENCK